ncbi:MAG: ABC transporter ATP-binding protein [Acidimicrobiales bacterium]
MSTVTLEPSAERTDQSPSIIEVRGLTKRFGDLVATGGVDFDVRPGEVHSLLGENGAGKSTLMKLLYGVYQPDAGEILVDGVVHSLDSPADARALGIGMVFQDLRLIPAFTVAENIALSLPGGGFRYRRQAVERQILEAGAELGFSVDPKALVHHLSIGERQRVEILKVLMSGARLVILDEPTSVLAPQEVDGLFTAIRSLRAKGLAVVIITHKLHETRAIADRLSILRAGRMVGSGIDPSTVDDRELISAMVGRDVPPLPIDRSDPPADRPAALRVTGVHVRGDGGNTALHDIHLEVRAGEVMGVAGVAGSGQRELYEAVLGLRPLHTGDIHIAAVEMAKCDPGAAIGLGAVGIPEDPISDAVVPGLDVTEHLALSNLASLRKGLGIDWARARELVAELDQQIGLRMVAHDRTVADLSGGNVQRVMLTRAFGVDCTLLVAAYPSRGLDVATTRRTQELLLAQREAGAGVLFISEDLDELMELSDQIAVLHNGHLAGVVTPAEVDRYAIGQLMLGGSE